MSNILTQRAYVGNGIKELSFILQFGVNVLF